ncbi:Zn-binding alcohol dehydrogenase [Rhodococcus opacus]|uniref:Zn-binding alcohol dehydrogenase n=1 Tax=Rhodococcus opacus TaxID=37919 RepID=A0A1B1K8E1_RHOOP|nr:Zn-binding alcohol dehydrogenase [Rhodococcus opacus]
MDAHCVVKVDQTLPLHILGPLGCSIQVGAGAVINVLRAAAGQSIAVFGLDTVGLSAVMAAKAVGYEPIIAIDCSADRRRLAAEVGATDTLDPSRYDSRAWAAAAVDANVALTPSLVTDISCAVADISPGGVDLSIETAGTEVGVQQALTVLRSPGTCVTLGRPGIGGDILIDHGHLMLGRTLTGSVGGTNTARLILRLLELWKSGQFPLDKLVQTHPWSDLSHGLAELDSSIPKTVVAYT